MERIKCEEMEMAGQTEPTSRSSFSDEKVIQIIPEEYPLVKLEPGIQDEFHAVINTMKCEETGQFETIYVKSVISSENDVVQSSEQNSEFSKVLLQSTDDKPTLCRLCATRGNDMIHMFDQNEVYKNVIEKIDYCLPIMVRETDTLPKQACRTCLEKLELCYQFHNSVAEAEKQLLSLDARTSREYCETSPLFNNEESQFEQGDCYSAPNSPMSPVHSGEELSPNAKVSDFENDFPLARRNNQVSDSLSIEAREDNNDVDKSQKILAKSGSEFKNKFVSQLKQKLSKLYHKSSTEPHSVSGDQLRTEENLSAHPKKNSPAVECDFCKKRFHSEVLQVHKETCGSRLLTKKKLFSCAYCCKEFSRKMHVEAHIRTHTRERPYSCKLCTQRFSTKRTRNDHLRIHMGQRLFKCFICEKTFKKACGLKGHARCHTYKIHCPVCNETFDTEARRNFHMARHADAKPCQ